MENNELMHYGIKGMKWGHRRYVADKVKGYQKDIDSFNPYAKTGIKTKTGKIVLTAQDVHDSIKALERDRDKRADKFGRKYDEQAAREKSRKAKTKNKTMNPSNADSPTTRRVKRDYNNLSDADFQRKYSVSKSTYKKRVDRYGDPYINSPLSKMGFGLSKMGFGKPTEKQRKRIDAMIKKMDKNKR